MLPVNRASGTIVVVTGLPRSGTSLAMQMLAAGGLPLLTDVVRPPDVDNPRGYWEYTPVLRTAQDPSWVAMAGGKAVKVVHALVPRLPPGQFYRIILMRRPLSQVLASQRKMLARLRRPGAALSDEHLGEIFTRQLSALETWMDQVPHVEWITLHYPEVVAEPNEAAAALNRFLGGELDEQAMAAQVDSTLYRQR